MHGRSRMSGPGYKLTFSLSQAVVCGCSENASCTLGI
jgi:hypothetical protein